MVDRRPNPLFRAVAVALFALTGGLSVGVPMVDAHETPSDTGIEESHDASRCFQHDHSLCVVFQQTPAETVHVSPFKPLGSPELDVVAPPSSDVTARAIPAYHSARAPPVLL